MHSTFRCFNSTMQGSTALGGRETGTLHTHALYESSKMHSILCLRQRLSAFQLTHHTTAAGGREKTFGQFAGAISQHTSWAWGQSPIIQRTIVTDAGQGIIHGVSQQSGGSLQLCAQHGLGGGIDDAGVLVGAGKGGRCDLDFGGAKVVLHRDASGRIGFLVGRRKLQIGTQVSSDQELSQKKDLLKKQQIQFKIQPSSLPQ